MLDKHASMILLAGGSGKRMGSDVAKQFLMLGNHPILWYSLKVMQESPYIDECVLVIRPEDEEYINEEFLSDGFFSKVKKIAYAGKERYESVWNGLNSLYKDNSSDYVFIHDGARPFLNGQMIEAGYKKVSEGVGCVLAVQTKDTVKIVDADGKIINTPERKTVWNMQTPQIFPLQNIYMAYKNAISAGDEKITDDAQVMELYGDLPVYVIEGEYTNIKVTTPEDLLVAMQILQGIG